MVDLGGRDHGANGRGRNGRPRGHIRGGQTAEGAGAGSSNGNIDDPQFQWLKGELQAAKDRNQMVVIFGHHPFRSMNAQSDSAWSRVDEDAARWVVRKEGAKLEPDTLAQFDAWYEADPLHAQTYDALVASWRRLDQVSVLPIARKKRKSRVKTLASACVLMGASFYAWQMFELQGLIRSALG